MVVVHRKEHFNAAHQLYNTTWSREKNEGIFGPCANENGHGHNFELYVAVKGEIDAMTGYVIDMKELSKLINKKIIDKVNHKNLNVDVPFMQGQMPSCENIVVGFWNILEPKIKSLAPHARLHEITLYETPRNFVNYKGG